MISAIDLNWIDLAMRTTYGSISSKEAYDALHEALEQNKGGGNSSYLQTMRNKYKTLLTEVFEHDKKARSAGYQRPGLARLLYPEGDPNNIEWGAKTKKKSRFSPTGPEKNMISGGWTANRFLKLMYQIPEMEMYLDTDGYRDQTHPVLQGGIEYGGEEEEEAEPRSPESGYGRYTGNPEVFPLTLT